MREAKFTPGPWYIRSTMRTFEDGTEVAFCIDASETCCVADVWSDDEESDSNAKLIAAAPEMYEALKAFVEAYEKSLQLEKTDVALRLAKAALSKAQQESEERK